MYTTIQKFVVRKIIIILFCKEINYLIQQGCIKIIKNYSKTFTLLQKICISILYFYFIFYLSNTVFLIK